MPPNSPIVVSLYATLIGFLASIIVVGIVGLIVGVVFGEGAVAQSGYFSELGNVLSFMYVLAPLTVIFGVAAWIKRDWSLVVYPFVAFGLAPGLINSPIVDLLANTLSDLVAVDRVRAGAAFAVMVSYMLAYVLISRLAALLRTPKLVQQERLRAFIVHGGLLAGSFIVGGLFLYGADTLNTTQARGRDAVRIPDTAQIVGRPVVTFAKDKAPQFNGVELIYKQATQQTDGTYQKIDSLTIGPITKSASDTRSVCGESLSTSSSSGQAGVLTYTTTPHGVTYGATQFEDYYTNPPREDAKYREYHYCFVVDTHKYRLTRSDRYGTAYLQQYPVVEVIDAIAAAQTYLPLCVDRGLFADEPSIASTPTYCTPEETTRLADLLAKSAGQRTRQ